METAPDWDRPLHEGLPRSRLCASCYQQIQTDLRNHKLIDGTRQLFITGPQDMSQSIRDRCRACCLSAGFELTEETSHGHHDMVNVADYTWVAEQSQSPSRRSFPSYFRLYPCTVPFGSCKRSDLWQKWIATCSASHEICSAVIDQGEDQRPTIPDRLVEISASNESASLTWRVVHGKDLGKVDYLTLSHCWGSSRPLTLESQNYESFFEPSECSLLPKTFKDAMTVAHTLGFSYIWIDSLCIIQDNLEDWEKEASKMGLIYQRACLNIAATWSSGCDGGLFVKQDISPIVSIEDYDGEPTEYILRQQRLYVHDISKAPLNKRGWVMQERVLTNRQLSFARGQIYWECHELAACEDVPDGIPEALHEDFLAGEIHEKPTLRRSGALRYKWTDLVRLYSSCAFSQLSDRVIAFAGLAEQMRDTTNDVYLAGLWRKDLVRQLCWQAWDETGNRRTSAYFAPSWSWFSIVGEIDFPRSYQSGEYQLVCSQVLKAEVMSNHHSKLHSFTGGQLVLRGILLPARSGHRDRIQASEDEEIFDGEQVSDDDGGYKTGDPELTNGHEIGVEITYDEDLSRSTTTRHWLQFCNVKGTDLFCMPMIMSGYMGVVGLLLKKVSVAVGDDTYTRVGVFDESWRKSLQEWLAFRLECDVGDLTRLVELDVEDPRLQDVIHTVRII